MPPSPNTTQFAPGSTLADKHDRADARGDAAADIAGGIEGRVLADFRHRNLGQHREVREGRAAHIVVDRLALVGEAARAVRHQPLALRGADRGAEIGLAAEAGFALAAFRRVERDDVIAGLHAGDARSNLPDDARAFMAKDGGEDALAVEPVQRIGVGMTDACGLDLDQHFAGLRPFQIDFDDFQRLFRLKSNGGACFQFNLLL